jgi:hypothetical protein
MGLPIRVFISHISEEAPIAQILKDWLESSFAGQCEVFVSSDKDDIPAGSRWLEVIDGAVGSASALIVLCSPSSISRPWINFEMGGAWVKRIPIIPICHSGQEKNSLPSPISMLQALELDDEHFVIDLLSSLAKHLGFGKVPRIDQAAMRKELIETAGGMVKGDINTAPVGETGKIADLLDEIQWRLSEITRTFGVLLEGHITVQGYQVVCDYIDKIFSGEARFYKQYDQERLIALAAKITNVRTADDLTELRSYLTDLERAHRSKRNYEEMIRELKKYQAILHSIQ